MGYQAYPQYESSGDTWLGDVPYGWTVLRADFLCEPIKKQISEAGLSGLEVFHYSIPVVQESGTGRVENGAEIDSAKLLIDQHQLLVSKLNPRKSTICLAEKQEQLTVASGEFIQIASRKIDMRYAYYTWLSDKVTKLLSSRVQSVTRSHQRVAPEDIYKLNWAWPSKIEQETIANFLDHKIAQIDQLIEKKQELIEKLQEQRITIITQAVTKGLDASASSKDSDVEWVGEVPAHWTVCKLSFRYSVDLGKMLDEKRITGDYLVPYLRNQDVQWGEINTENLPEMDINPQEETRFTVKAGDLLVCEGGDIGRAAIWRRGDMSVGFQKALHRLRPYSEKNDTTDFFYFSLIAAKYRGAFDESDTRATISHLPAEKFRQFRFAFPPLSEQVLITKHLRTRTARLDAMLINNQNAIERLQEYRTALITAAVTGQIDVRDWQAPASAKEPEADKEVA